MSRYRNLTTAYYGLYSGKRVRPAYGKRHPTKVLTLTLDSNFLRGYAIELNSDMMPANLEQAQMAKLYWDTHQAKLRLRRANYAAKKTAARSKKIVAGLNKLLRLSCEMAKIKIAAASKKRESILVVV